METLFSMIPAQYMPWVNGAFALVTLASLVGAGVKKWMGDPSPSDGPWRRRVFLVLGIVDWVAANSEPIKHKLQRTGSVPPKGGAR